MSDPCKRLKSVAGRKRRKSVSDVVNDQFIREATRGHDVDAWDDVGGDAPQIDDYYEWDENNHDDGEEYHGGGASSASAVQKQVETKRNVKTQDRQQKRLRRRGPLDESLMTGEYAATPVDVEAAMDNIFGALEVEDDDFDGEFTEEGEKSKGRKHKKRETEEEYIKMLEARQEKKRVKFRGTDEEGDILQQLEDLRSAQMQLLHQREGEEDSDPRAEERERTQAAVRHYLMVYSQLLRTRIKLQPAVVRAAAFPQYYALNDFVENGGTSISEGIAEVRRYLRDILGVLSSLADDKQAGGRNANKKGSAARAVPSFNEIDASHQRIITAADVCVDYWGSKLVQANSAKLCTVSQPLLQQIRAILTGKGRLRTRVQKNHSHVTILGHPGHYHATQTVEGKAARALHIAEGDIDHEIYNDADFLSEVVRRSGGTKLQQQLQETQQGTQHDREPTKRGFHRLTKGKAVNYEPRPKLVGFLLPVPYSVGGQHEVLVKSLFQ
ncbi:putative AATF protein [Trypanosoma vivax]|uniref:AATF leucine zipper-containing domain-containing protein n=1 Tax=Trypanosoma vivax (strain Y486) TaxID=1055687 RepID=G0TR65_TRYVY|nr:hypothetical protein TRVL_05918 [Trypanosoma vivax]KAH8611246.1 putative AATF protein [Trypanosoma vivax]CCC46429.1 conserved hypothetical protein [Trypanosoma vivax Y486]